MTFFHTFYVKLFWKKLPCLILQVVGVILSIYHFLNFTRVFIFVAREDIWNRSQFSGISAVGFSAKSPKSCCANTLFTPKPRVVEPNTPITCTAATRVSYLCGMEGSVYGRGADLVVCLGGDVIAMSLWGSASVTLSQSSARQSSPRRRRLAT